MPLQQTLQAMNPMMINENIANYLAHHEQILQRLLATIITPAEQLKTAILYSLFPGGKRFRPLLVYLCGEILDINMDCRDLIAAAVEITHCYSLIHDDLPAMDDDDMRRGKPSCHKAFGEATAILAGDAMQSLAVEILLKNLSAILPASQVIAVTQELVHASGIAGMVSGQSLDLSELTKPAISEPQLRLIHSLKTGKLICACIKMILAVQQFSQETTVALNNFACYLGLVFQMQDDYLDHYADVKVLGKGRSSDLANQKITFTALYSKIELLGLIDELYQKAKEELVLFGQKANNLLALTDFLHQRSSKQ